MDRLKSRSPKIEQIKAIARQQIHRNGAAALSLGAIARELGVTTPALYRYFDGRDALVTQLIVDAHASLADSLDDAATLMGAADVADRFTALLLAYREWALAHPADYHLMLGAPIAGYQPPPETVAAALCSMHIFGELISAAVSQGRLQIPASYLAPPASFQQALVALRQQLPPPPLPDVVMTLALMVWIRAHGLLGMELHGQLPPALLSSGDLYRMEIAAMVRQLGLQVDAPTRAAPPASGQSAAKTGE